MRLVQKEPQCSLGNMVRVVELFAPGLANACRQIIHTPAVAPFSKQFFFSLLTSFFYFRVPFCITLHELFTDSFRKKAQKPTSFLKLLSGTRRPYGYLWLENAAISSKLPTHNALVRLKSAVKVTLTLRYPPPLVHAKPVHGRCSLSVVSRRWYSSMCALTKYT